MTIERKLLFVAVYQAVGDEIGVKSEPFGSHILADVIADHDAFFRVDAAYGADFFIVVEVGLAGRGVVIGGDIIEVVYIQPCPMNTAVGGRFRKNRIGCHNQLSAMFFDKFNAGAGKRLNLGRRARRVKLGAVEVVDDIAVATHVAVAGAVHALPEDIDVKAVSVIARHVADARPDGIHQSICVDFSNRHHFFAVSRNKELDKIFHVHRQQGAVEVKEIVFVLCVSPIFII